MLNLAKIAVFIFVFLKKYANAIEKFTKILYYVVTIKNRR